MKKRNERRRATAVKLAQRATLMEHLGLQGGCVYAKHRKKIQSSLGYMRSGHVSHFVSTHPRKKTRSRDRYGPVFLPPKRDIVRLDSLNQQQNDEQE